MKITVLPDFLIDWLDYANFEFHSCSQDRSEIAYVSKISNLVLVGQPDSLVINIENQQIAIHPLTTEVEFLQGILGLV